MNEPIIILGAARSGTKMLRDTLAEARDLRVVEYDVNYVWRFGNENYPNDKLPPELATEFVSKFVRRQLSAIAIDRSVAPRNKSGRFIEKTVGNVVRLPFVHRIYPRARYVFLIRDGRDVAASAIRCWQQPPEIGYLLRKLRTFPWRAGMRYGLSYGCRVLQRRCGLSPHLSSWGPRYPGIDDDVSGRSLAEVCARQWVACVEEYEQAKHVLSPDQITEVRYEDLVRQPASCLPSLCQRLEIRDEDAVLTFADSNMVAGHIGKRTTLSEEVRQEITEIQSGVLERWGYTARLAAQHVA